MTKTHCNSKREVIHSRRSDSRPFSATTGATTSGWRRPTVLSKLRRKSADWAESGMQTKRTATHSTGSQESMTIVVISDTHELHREVDIPAGSLLIHCGDLTMFSRSLRAIHDFNQWLGELSHRHRILVPGNHDRFLEDLSNRKLISNATVLINEGIDVEGLRIWGTPITPVGPAFCVPSTEERRRIYERIPNDTDVLISHGPPHGILDRSQGSSFHAGDQELLYAVTRVKPRLHFFGHIHAAHGLLGTHDTLFGNAALLGPEGDIDKQPIVVRMVRK
jgi:Icc-related predicted phosphoesterase